jgi:glucose/arabinose dehydrogenase
MALGILAMALAHVGVARADSIPTMVTDPNLEVTPVATGFSQPIGIAFLGSPNDFLVLEKASGQIKRVINGVIQPTPVLDLAVNSNSERGLLSMVLHPDFPVNPSVVKTSPCPGTPAPTTPMSGVTTTAVC